MMLEIVVLLLWFVLAELVDVKSCSGIYTPDRSSFEIQRDGKAPIENVDSIAIAERRREKHHIRGFGRGIPVRPLRDIQSLEFRRVS